MNKKIKFLFMVLILIVVVLVSVIVYRNNKRKIIAEKFITKMSEIAIDGNYHWKFETIEGSIDYHFGEGYGKDGLYKIQIIEKVSKDSDEYIEKSIFSNDLYLDKVNKIYNIENLDDYFRTIYIPRLSEINRFFYALERCNINNVYNSTFEGKKCYLIDTDYADICVDPDSFLPIGLYSKLGNKIGYRITIEMNQTTENDVVLNEDYSDYVEATTFWGDPRYTSRGIIETGVF